MDEPAIRQAMLRHFRAARKDYVQAHKSRHWDIFADNYETLIEDASLWPDFRRNKLNAGIGWSIEEREARDKLPLPPIEIRDPHRIAGEIARFDSLATLVGEAFATRFVEATIGAPEHVAHKGLRLDEHDMRNVMDAWFISKLMAPGGTRPLRIVEIGGGFGSLAGKLYSIFPGSMLVLFDLPETNALQSWYLNRLFPGIRWAGYADLLELGAERIFGGEFQLVVLPGWTTNALPDRSADLGINTRSMAEMNNAVVGGYVRELQRFIRPGGIFYCVNRYSKNTVGEHVRLKNYPFDDRWYAALSQTAWDQPSIHTLALVRTELPNAHPPADTLKRLPPRTWKDARSSFRAAFGDFGRFLFGTKDGANAGLPILRSISPVLRQIRHRLSKIAGRR